MSVLRTLFSTAVLSLIAGVSWAEDAVSESGAAVAEAAHGEAHKGLPQFDPTSWPSQIFWLVLFFSVLYVFFAKKALPSLGKTIETRKDHIQGALKQAESLSTQAEQTKAAYELALRKAMSEASKEIKATQDAGKAKLAAGIADFRARSEQEIETAEARLAAAKVSVLKDINAVAAEIASEAALKLAGINTDQSQAENVVRLISEKKAKAA